MTSTLAILAVDIRLDDGSVGPELFNEEAELGVVRVGVSWSSVTVKLIEEGRTFSSRDCE